MSPLAPLVPRFRLIPALFVAALCLSAQAQPSPEMQTIDTPQGARRVEVMQVGDGPVTVVFESGFTMGWGTWRPVLPALAGQARLLTYSRTGTGKSDPAQPAPTVADRTAELEALIRARQLKPPFVLVGHSYGGLVVRQFATQHPQQVLGVVLVDPASESYYAALRRIDAARAEREDRTQVERAPATFQGEYAYVMSLMQSGTSPERGAWPQVPTVLLTSTKPEWPDLLAFGAPGRAAWRQAHADWFARVGQGAYVVTEASGHFIQRDEPELVVQAVLSVLQRGQAQAKRLAQAEQRRQLDAALAALKPGAADLPAQVAALIAKAELNEADTNALGYRLLKGQPSLAGAVLRHNAERFPQSINAQDSWGEALLAQGDAAGALRQFDLALRLADVQNASPKQRQAVAANREKALAAAR